MTTCPLPDAMSEGSSAFVTRIVPRTLDSHIQRQCSSSASIDVSVPSRAAGVVDQGADVAEVAHPPRERLDDDASVTSRAGRCRRSRRELAEAVEAGAPSTVRAVGGQARGGGSRSRSWLP